MAWSDAARRAALEARRRKRLFVYHGTSAEYAEKIRREGLKPVKEARINTPALYRGPRGNAVFVTTDEKAAASYARTVAQKRAEERLGKPRLTGDAWRDVRHYAARWRWTQRQVRKTATVLKFSITSKIMKQLRRDRHAGLGDYWIPKKLSAKYLA